MDNYNDLQYYVTLEVGGQPLRALADTTSVELVVLSSECNYWCGHNKTLYEPRKSRAHRDGPLGVALSLNSGNLYGHSAFDEYAIGEMKAFNQPFWEITDANMIMLFKSNFNAIIGLGLISNKMDTLKLRAVTSYENSFQYALALMKLGVVSFSFCLDAEPGKPGYITWRETVHLEQPQRFATISTIVDQPGFWLGTLKHVYLGDVPLGCMEGCGTIFDSTTPLLALPSSAHASFLHAIEEIPNACADMRKLPALTFQLGGHNFTLPPDSYLGNFRGAVAPGLAGRLGMGRGRLEGPAGACQPAILRMDLESSLGHTWVFGLPFFRSYYTVFVQGEHPRIHAAPSHGRCSLGRADLQTYAGGRATPRDIDASGIHLPIWMEQAKNNGQLPNLHTGTLARNFTRWHRPRKHK